MYSENVEKTVALLRKNKIKFKVGMTEDEILRTEKIYGIMFPTDLKELFKVALPVSEGFYDWNDYSSANIAQIRKMVDWPVDGILFDVEKNEFWIDEWGLKPHNREEREKIIKDKMKLVPRLIPVYSHRYISSFPNEIGNPVYSVYQTDIIFYGEDIWDYFTIEYKEKKHQDIKFDKIKKIPFWHDIIIGN